MKKETHRIESDSMGEIPVAHACLWGAQTERSLTHFSIGTEKMPPALIHAFGILKKACAIVNQKLGLLPAKLADQIIAVSEEIAAGKLDDEFPLRVWQTGSGTQTNMNVNEVISNRTAQILGGTLGTKQPLHPNDHVNLSQSSNDTFPTAMHIAAAQEIEKKLLPALQKLLKALKAKEEAFKGIIKIGRTHLMDAVPLTLSQEFSGYSAQIDECMQAIKESEKGFFPLAIGGTAVGTGLNAPKDFGEAVSKEVARLTELPFKSAPNKFLALSSHNAFVLASGAFKALACSLTKIANDIRWMGSGPRSGLNELTLPANEPGSSIMPGKVNPTQCEALTMICAQIFGNDAAITFSASQGNFELNVYKPVIYFNFQQSLDLLSDGINSFVDHLLKDLKANPQRIREHLDRSLMLITALSPKLGYETCAKIAHQAYQEDKSLKSVCLELKLLTSEEFDKLVKPEEMV